uniref:Uncharacterized protein LOC113792291 n=1 Tax=Dermatophagoides pteronyssinus TaxID=6956 RepID=A0A6P6XXY8_DERPT|nr:uncharacterized protein LOC113792291 [Dermatophagoides pteronyssinus]
MYKNIVIIIKLIGIIIVHQCTTSDQHNVTGKQEPRSIPCVVRYDYGKLSENHDKKIDGNMLDKGLEDLISLDIVNKLMTVIQWKGKDEESKNNANQSPIISMAISINEQTNKTRIYCLKSYDRLTYQIGDYNQEIDMNEVKIFTGVHEENQIMGAISYQNKGIISSFYGKLSYRIKMYKFEEKQYGTTNFEWKKSLVVDSGLNLIYQFDETPSVQQQQEFIKSFAQIFGPYSFTYGFVDKGQIYLFSSHDDKVITFSMDIFENMEQKYPFKLQSYRDFINCNKKIEPIIIDNKHNNGTDVPNNEPKEFSTTILIIIVASIIIFLLLIVSLVCFLRKKSGKKNPVKKLLPKQQINLDGKSHSLISPSKTTTTATSAAATSTATMNEKTISNSSMLSRTPSTTKKMSKIYNIN